AVLLQVLLGQLGDALSTNILDLATFGLDGTLDGVLGQLQGFTLNRVEFHAATVTATLGTEFVLGNVVVQVGLEGSGVRVELGAFGFGLVLFFLNHAAEVVAQVFGQGLVQDSSFCFGQGMAFSIGSRNNQTEALYGD